MSSIILFNKPFRTLSQFTDTSGRRTLADYIQVEDFYPAGRLDYESEGLLVLTDDNQLKSRITDPKHKMSKTYWAQVEGILDESVVKQLRAGVELKDGITLPAKATQIEAPHLLWERFPPIRERQHIPTRWISLTLWEGRNRQVRRMTAAVGHPTLRLIRYRVGSWTVDGLAPGEWRMIKL